MCSERALDGIVLLDKPAGGTSHGAVAHLRRILRTRHIGHGGTLDPAATGVLVILVGRATRLAGFLGGGTKVYEATFRFGTATTTDDAAGEVIETADVPELDFGGIEASKNSFVGELGQVPPAFSAVRSDGVRAYRRARRGQAMELAPRKVTISEIEILEWVRPDLRLKVSCTSGTYIRALARDWGRAIGSAAHVRSLRRVKSGLFDIAECLSFEQIEQLAASGAWEHFIVPPGPALEKAIGRTTIVEGQDEKRFLNGAPIAHFDDFDGISVVFSRERELLGIGRVCAGVLRPVLVYPSL